MPYMSKTDKSVIDIKTSSHSFPDWCGCDSYGHMEYYNILSKFTQDHLDQFKMIENVYKLFGIIKHHWLSLWYQMEDERRKFRIANWVKIPVAGWSSDSLNNWVRSKLWLTQDWNQSWNEIPNVKMIWVQTGWFGELVETRWNRSTELNKMILKMRRR